MRRNKFLLPLLLGLLVIVSCSKESMISNKSATDKLNDLGIIPLEQALSTNCLNPAKGEEYDYQDKWDKEVKKNNFTYSWHFRLITYNVPAN